MKFVSRFASVTAGAALVLLASVAAHAESPAYPTRNIKIVVGFGAGGGVDIVARLVAQKMQESLGQTVIVENRTGGSGMIGPDTVAKSTPDGYTLLYGASGQMVISPAVYDRMSYVPLKDFIPISMMAGYPLIMITSVNHPANTMKEFIAWTKANPDKTNYASASAAFILSTELFKLKTGTPGQPITFRSSNDSATNVIGEQVTYAIAEPPPLLPLVKGGKARALAVTAPKRMTDLPDVPTMHETGADVDVRLWTGLFAPAGTSPEIVKKLEEECMRIAKLPDFQQKLRALSTDTVGSTSAEFTKVIENESKMWSEVAKSANVSIKR